MTEPANTLKDLLDTYRRALANRDTLRLFLRAADSHCLATEVAIKEWMKDIPLLELLQDDIGTTP